MRLTVKSAQVKASPSKALAAAAFATAENVLSDCTRYVPVLHGNLRDSGQTRHGPDGSASVMWGTDALTARYARRQYYDEGLSHTTALNPANAGTGPHWFETAKASRQAAWESMFQKVYKGSL